MQDYIRALLEAGIETATEQNLNLPYWPVSKKVVVRSITNTGYQPVVYGAATSVTLPDGDTYMTAYYVAERMCMAATWNTPQDFKLQCYCLVVWRLV